jgi:AraC-like DNA-binding protein
LGSNITQIADAKLLCDDLALGDRMLAKREPSLHRFSSSEFGSADALSAAFAPAHGPTVVEPTLGSPTFQAKFDVFQSSKIAIGRTTFKQASRLKLAACNSFVHGFPVQGTCEHINNGVVRQSSLYKGSVVAPGSLSLSCSPGYEILSISIGPETLSNVLSGLTGSPAIVPLKLDRSNYDSRPEPPVLRGLVSLMIEELDSEGAELSPLALAELEQAILVAFLCGVGHNYSHLLDAHPSGTAPWQVRRVEEYIEANWDQPISIEGLAIVANVSARSIFHSFREHRHYSPSNFVKQVRLRHAREILNKPGDKTSVTRVAFDCGFGNLGHFAKDYQRAFGETPSATLNRSKRRA